MYGELLANSDGVRGDCGVSPGSCGVKEAEIGASHPHLSAEVKSRGETWLLFSEIGALDTVASTVLRDFYSSSLTSRLSHLHGCVGHYRIYFALSFPEVHFLRRHFPRECSVIAEISQKWVEGMVSAGESAFFSAHLPLGSFRHFEKTATTGI